MQIDFDWMVNGEYRRQRLERRVVTCSVNGAAQTYPDVIRVDFRRLQRCIRWMAASVIGVRFRLVAINTNDRRRLELFKLVTLGRVRTRQPRASYKHNK